MNIVFLLRAFHKIFIDHWNLMGVSYSFQHSPQQICTSLQIDFKVSNKLQNHGRSNKTEIRGFIIVARTPDKIGQVSAALSENPKFSERSFTRIGFTRSFTEVFTPSFTRIACDLSRHVCSELVENFALWYNFFLYLEEISPEMFRKLRTSFQNLFQACVVSNEGHVPAIASKT